MCPEEKVSHLWACIDHGNSAIFSLVQGAGHGCPRAAATEKCNVCQDLCALGRSIVGRGSSVAVFRALN